MRWLMIVCLVLLINTSLQANGTQRTKTSSRARRQRRPQLSFLSLVSSFISETVSDTRVAVNNITQIIHEQFPPSSQNGSKNGTAVADKALSLKDVSSILSRNYRSLVRLFNTELMNAIQDSRKNVARYRAEFRQALNPFFQPSTFFKTTTNNKNPS